MFFFYTMLSRFEHELILSREKKDENENEMTLKTDKTHRFVIAIKRFIMKYCKTALQFFIRVSDFLTIVNFKWKLQNRKFHVFWYAQHTMM